MNKAFTEGLAKFVEESSFQSSQASFRWLNPAPENLKQKDVQILLSQLPQNIQENLLNNSELRVFFQDDMRALQLYLQLLPNTQILSEASLDDHINPEDFNQFFRENYITNQAYKLSKNVRDQYMDEISGNTSWQEYVLQENTKDQNSNKIQPDYSIKYFLTSLNPVSRLDYLKKINTQSLSKEDISPINPNVTVNDLPELNKANSYNFQSPSPTKNLLNSESTTQNISQTRKEAVQNSEISFGSAPANQTIKTEFPFQNISNANQKVSPIGLKLKEELVQADQGISQFEQRLQSTVTNQNSSQNNEKTNINKTTDSNQVTPSISIPIQEEVSRRKPVNYAKIVGYSSAAGLSIGTSGLTLLNTLFGS